ncbi:MAG TPA: hypothetical protein VFV84_02385 [Burkholderiales bacterium]|nr:hypothetical protein [Burkholderiales bacterium]
MATTKRKRRGPKRQGKNVKSEMLRVDADFAALCRKRAGTDKTVTEVTREMFVLLNGGAS